MRRLVVPILLAVLSLAIVSCGKVTAHDIPMDDSVPSDQANHLGLDWKLLGNVTMPTPTTEDLYTVGISDFSPTTMKAWVRARVKFLVGESYTGSGLTKEPFDSYRTRPQLMSAGQLDAGKLYTLMVNLGSALYLDGKKNSYIYTVPVANQSVRVTSPRSGIIQIGEGLFIANQISTSDVDSTVNALLRLAVLFHEARHSDGNGQYAAFPHATCTTRSNDPNFGYAGKEGACEQNLNGPYAVQVVMLRNFYGACTDCDSTEKAGILRLIGDYQSRLEPNADWHDDTPEELR